MNTIYLSDFTGGDDLQRFRDALAEAKKIPGTTVIVPPGVYNISTPRARQSQLEVMRGDYGINPEPTMFNPNYPYDSGIDFTGHRDTTLIAPEGAMLMVDGFMEPISVKDCRGVTVDGFTVDHKRRPYTKGTLTFKGYEGDDVLYDCTFSDPINEKSARPRHVLFVNGAGRFDTTSPLLDVRLTDELHAVVKLGRSKFASDTAARELYLWHTFHTRPVVLVERARDSVIRNITIHSAPGMGITAMHADNILVERLRVVPAPGENMSTNTDATHFSSCRGLLRMDGCEFDGQGDDSLNVHTYYYTPERISDRVCRLRVEAPTGTHTQSIDRPEVGDTLEVVSLGTLMPLSEYKVLSVTVNTEDRTCDVVVDRDLPDTFEGTLICDPDAVPNVEFVNCHANNHFARSILIKSRRALIENCTVTNVFDVAVKVAAEACWKEGINMDEVIIRDCRFVGNGCWNSFCGGISVTMDTVEPGSMPQGRVIIENNIIDAPNSDFAIVVARTREAVIKGNTLSSRKTPHLYVVSDETVLDCDTVSYKG